MIAETLLEKETITAEEIEYLCAHGTLPPKLEPKKDEPVIPAEETPLIPPPPTPKQEDDGKAAEETSTEPSSPSDDKPEGGHQA